MKLCLIIAYIGNLIDTACTLYLCDKGFVEANPIMARLLDYPALFAVVKILAMTAVCAWLWVSRGRYARICAYLAAAVYGAIAVYYGVILAVMTH